MVANRRAGSLLFCPDCGTLLDVPQGDDTSVRCDQCGHEEPASSYENIEITTRSHPEAFPSSLRQKRKTQTKVHEAGAGRLKVTEKCPECGHMEAYSEEKQMRSADEGSTILYECANCKHGWRTNN
ncbi:transcription factor S-II-domain-containing protein [Vararia minispora EC-137]|uniref:Transcription factor S-II-domain-containing protein n=1 Tax=Vararia minispora EC-137 TaxID=1314806 RepID=A0ACB8Q6B9_9AGAM|nr:transcription factor S-II-domain-containing protein [Vararia minispora EC-137]